MYKGLGERDNGGVLMVEGGNKILAGKSGVLTSIEFFPRASKVGLWE